MLSSPERTHVVQPMELAELRPSVIPSTELPEFRSAHPLLSEPPLFLVAAEHEVNQQILDEARIAAEAVGYAQGWAAGLRESRNSTRAERIAAAAEYKKVAAERRERTAHAVAAMDRAASNLEQRALTSADEIQTAIIESAFAIAEALIGAHLRDDTARGAQALSRALSLAPRGEHVTVTVSPADYATLTSNGAVAIPDAENRRIDLVADDSFASGDAVASWDGSSVDARLSTGLERVREVLSR